MGRTIAWIVSLGLLTVIAVLGLQNGLTDWGEGSTAFQQSVAVGSVLYGILGLITAYGLLRRRRWTLRTAIAWGIVVTYVPGAAVMSYGGEDAMLGSALAASGATALIALGVIWAVNVVTRTPPRPTAD